MSAEGEKTILVTGANGELASVLVDRLLAAGYSRIACQYRSGCDRVGEVLRKHGLDAGRFCFQADLSSEAEVQAMGRAVRERLGAPWGLVNAAGASTSGMSWKLTLEKFQGALNDNLISTFLCCREFLPDMRAEKAGRVVNLSSVVASLGAIGASHYAAAKAAVEGFTRSIAREVADKGITVNAVAVGYMEVGLIRQVPEAFRMKLLAEIPLARFGRAEELAGLVLHLLGPGSSYCTGQVFHLDGGLSQ